MASLALAALLLGAAAAWSAPAPRSQPAHLGPEGAGLVAVPPFPDAGEGVAVDAASACAASGLPPRGFHASRTLHSERQRQVVSNNATVVAALALAPVMERPIRASEVVNISERTDEVCAFFSDGWFSDQVYLTRTVTSYERNVSLRKDLAVHLIALERGGSVGLEEVMDVSERRSSVRAFEGRVELAPHDALLRLALEGSSFHGSGIRAEDAALVAALGS